eukprot:c21951_g1_i1.p1 GENE.c21951_g1_i1~~c21951_g1_i1.p1  ORF type:complete len:1871 (-),score=718.46 c21951_g1_i1:35-5647(-)
MILPVSFIILFLVLYSEGKAKESNDILVMFSSHITDSEAKAISNEQGFNFLGRVGVSFGNVFRVKYHQDEEDIYQKSEDDKSLVEKAQAKSMAIKNLQEHNNVLHLEKELIKTMQKKEEVTQCGITLSDPLWEDQWHLCNTGQGGGTAGVDVDVAGAWEKEYFGDDVQIAIVDDGVYHSHPDLVSKYIPEDSYDYNSKDFDPMAEDEDSHGTSCAGVAVAAKETTCGVGVAPNAVFSAIRLISQGYTTSDEMLALSHHINSNHIFSNSWGPRDCSSLFGCEIERMPELLRAQLSNNVKYGREGKGTIYVWAAGNGGINDDVNYDGYANSMYAIAVAACNDDGKRSIYSEPGAAIHVCAPSSDSGHSGIFTTALPETADLEGNCTARFGGTSSATPLVSGIIALILSANQDLGWRDVKHILKQSAIKTDPTDSDWFQNAANVWVSHSYGFGRVQASRAVDLASNWTNVPSLVSFYKSQKVSQYIGRQKKSFQINISKANSENISKNDQRVVLIEMIEVIVWISCQEIGSVTISIVSPSGTRSNLARTRSDSTTNYDGWIFTSVHFWDEKPEGNWTLEIKDTRHANSRLEKWSLGIHGTGFIEDLPRVCGDGLLSSFEACDDFNNISDDGCSNCRIDFGWVCSEASNGTSFCHPICGDGYKLEIEECDDGNNIDGDGCDTLCEIEQNFYCVIKENTNMSFCHREGECRGLEVYDESNGTISDSDGSGKYKYSNGLYCAFLIQPAEPGDWIGITFTSFETELFSDIVTIYDGPTENSSIIVELSGPSLPINKYRTSQGDAMLIVFQSDQSKNFKGFEFEFSTGEGFESVCELTNQINGFENPITITDGSGEYTYLNEQLCSWMFSPELDDNQTIVFEFSKVVIGEGDMVAVIDGEYNLITVYSNEIAFPEKIRVTGNAIVAFRSDEDYTADGFELTYSIGSVLPSYPNQTFTERSGSFNDGSGEFIYDSNVTCHFQIIPELENDDWILLTFDSIETETKNDYIQIFEISSNGSLISKTSKISGKIYQPIQFYSPPGSKGFFVQFVSDESYALNGFYARWIVGTGVHECFGSELLTLPTGNITDGSGEGSYKANKNCNWVIQPSGDYDWITLTFIDFDLESQSDTVQVYDGPDEDSELLGIFSGSSIPPPIASSQGKALYIVFKTDNSIQKGGFTARYVANIGRIPKLYCSPLTVYTKPTGIIESNLMGFGYQKNSNCTFSIELPYLQYSAINLTFLTFETEFSADYVLVFDENYNIMASFSGVKPFVLTLSSVSEPFVEASIGRFGGDVPAYILTSDVVLADPFDACSTIRNKVDLIGKIALVQRGTCDFVLKAQNIEAAGAIAVLIQNTNDMVFEMKGAVGSVSIPAILIPKYVGDTILQTKNSTNQTVTAKLSSSVVSPTNKMVVVFESNSNNQFNGFSAYFSGIENLEFKNLTCHESPKVVKESVGFLDFGTRNTLCHAVIMPSACSLPPNQYIELHIEPFPKMTAVLEIRDGASNKAPLIASLSSLSTTTKYSSSQSKSLYIVYRGNITLANPIHITYISVPTAFSSGEISMIELFESSNCFGESASFLSNDTVDFCDRTYDSGIPLTENVKSILVPKLTTVNLFDGCSIESTIFKTIHATNSSNCVSVDPSHTNFMISSPLMVSESNQICRGYPLVFGKSFGMIGLNTIKGIDICDVIISPSLCDNITTISLEISELKNGEIIIYDGPSSKSSRLASWSENNETLLTVTSTQPIALFVQFSEDVVFSHISYTTNIYVPTQTSTTSSSVTPTPTPTPSMSATSTVSATMSVSLSPTISPKNEQQISPRNAAAVGVACFFGGVAFAALVAAIILHKATIVNYIKSKKNNRSQVFEEDEQIELKQTPKPIV